MAGLLSPGESHRLTIYPPTSPHRTTPRLFADPDEKIQEQAFYVVRNLAEDEFGIDLVFQELGSDVLLNSMISALESPYEEVVLQVRYSI